MILKLFTWNSYVSGMTSERSEVFMQKQLK